MIKENIIEVINFDGKSEKIEILKYFKLKQNKKDYILYKKDNAKNESIVFAAEVVEKQDEIMLNNIEDREILDKIKNIMEELHSNG